MEGCWAAGGEGMIAPGGVTGSLAAATAAAAAAASLQSLNGEDSCVGVPVKLC